nr:YdeI/OmpD-associated family protein [Auraticoccus cholistanensis]
MDTAPREVEVPDDLARALQRAGLTEAFSALSYSHQRRHVLQVEGARTEATRLRRVEAVVAALAG